MLRGDKMKYGILSGVLMIGCLCHAAGLSFSLNDSYGRQVKSQDYEGIPIFLEFGACW
jgi:hypothetical protein